MNSCGYWNFSRHFKCCLSVLVMLKHPTIVHSSRFTQTPCIAAFAATSDSIPPLFLSNSEKVNCLIVYIYCYIILKLIVLRSARLHSFPLDKLKTAQLRLSSVINTCCYDRLCVRIFPCNRFILYNIDWLVKFIFSQMWRICLLHEKRIRHDLLMLCKILRLVDWFLILMDMFGFLSDSSILSKLFWNQYIKLKQRFWLASS